MDSASATLTWDPSRPPKPDGRGTSAPAAGLRVDNIVGQFEEIPEPGTLALFGVGLSGLDFARRRRTTLAD